MKKGLTELVMILDRSGSMSGLEADTIGGFNSLIDKQKKEEGEAYVSVVLFDDRSEVLYDRVDIRKIEPMNDKEDVPEKTIFIITTDGMENASHQYTYEKVRRMIERRKEQYHWEFMFLGANIDAVKEAGRFGINASRAVRYENDSAGTQLNYKVLSHVVGCARKAATVEDMEAVFDDEEMLAPIREDYAKRHRD